MLNFDEKEHRYFNDKNETYTSATQIIEHYTPYFEEDFWLKYKVLQDKAGFNNDEEGKKLFSRWLTRTCGFSFKNKTVLITGGLRGIGHVITQGFLKNQADVILLGRNLNALELFDKEFLPHISTYECDLNNSEAIQKTMDDVFRKTKKIDSFIHCDLYKIGLESGKKYSKLELIDFVRNVIRLCEFNKVYFKDSILKAAGINRADLPENCVGRDYNMFKL